MRSLLLCALAACSHPDASPAPISDRPRADPAVAPLPVATPPPPIPPRRAQPAGMMRSLATLDDAELAVTTDTRGELRFWPSLDGKRPPVIVPVTRPSVSTTLLHTDTGLALLSLDGLGQLEIVRIAMDGTWLSRADVELPRPIIACAATSTGFVALRDDQIIEGIDSNGQVFGDLLADPGMRVTSFVQRSGHVLALLEGKKSYGQSIEIDDDSISWGTRSLLPAYAMSNIALSPDGTRIAATREGKAVVLDLATGKIKARARLDERDVSILAWKDDATVWFVGDQTTFDWTIARAVPDPLLEFLRADRVAGAAMLSMDDRGLEVYRNAKIRHLGYRLSTLADVVAMSNGWLATDGARVVRFDAKLQLKTTVKTAPEGGVVLLDGRHFYAPVSYELGKVFTVGRDDDGAPLPKPGVKLEFQRATGIAMNDPGDAFQFMHWNAQRGAFDDAVAVKYRGTQYGTARLFDPLLTEGVAAEIEVFDANGSVERTVARSIDPNAAEPFRAAAKRGPIDAPSGMAATTADGTLIATIVDHRMTLRDRDGNVRWERSPRGATGLAWNADNELVAFGDGLTEVDQETGDFVDPQCGWQFGSWTDPIARGGGAGMCTGGDGHADMAFEQEVIEDETP